MLKRINVLAVFCVGFLYPGPGPEYQLTLLQVWSRRYPPPSKYFEPEHGRY